MRRWWVSGILGGVVLLAGLVRLIPPARAALQTNVAVKNNQLAVAIINAPEHLSAKWRGQDVVLNWQSREPKKAELTFDVWGVPVSSPACRNAEWVRLARLTDQPNLRYVDANRSLAAGQWMCYRVQTVEGGWSSEKEGAIAVLAPRASELSVTKIIAPAMPSATQAIQKTRRLPSPTSTLTPTRTTSITRTATPTSTIPASTATVVIPVRPSVTWTPEVTRTLARMTNTPTATQPLPTLKATVVPTMTLTPTMTQVSVWPPSPHFAANVTPANVGTPNLTRPPTPVQP